MRGQWTGNDNRAIVGQAIMTWWPFSLHLQHQGGYLFNPGQVGERTLTGVRVCMSSCRGEEVGPPPSAGVRRAVHMAARPAFLSSPQSTNRRATSRPACMHAGRAAFHRSQHRVISMSCKGGWGGTEGHVGCVR